MAVAIHQCRSSWNFAREDTDPIAPLRPEGPWGPWAMHGAQCQQKPVPMAPIQNATQKMPNPTQGPMLPQNAEVAPVVLWEKPPKPAGWSAIWEVLPPPPPPPFGQDGVWIWVPEGEEAPVGGMVPHEGAFLPCADLDDDSEEADAASQIPAEFQGFTNPMQAPFAEKSLGPAPASEYSSSGGLQETQIVQISNSTLPATSEHIAVSHQSNVPLGFSGVFHSQKSVHSTPPAHAAGMSAGQRGFGSAKDAFGMPSPATPRPGNEDAFSTKSATAATAFQSNPYPSLPGVVQATMRETPPPSQTQVWNPFPTGTTISADPPVEQAWNPWASIGDGDGPFSRSLQDTQRRIIGDIGAFTSDDWRPPAGNVSPRPSNAGIGMQSTPRGPLGPMYPSPTPGNAPFAEKSLGPAPASEYSSSGGLQETQIVQISNSTLPATSEHIAVSHQSNVPLGFSGVFHSQKSVHSTPPAHAAGMSAGQRGFGSAKDAFGMPSPATPRPGNEDAFSTKSATAATAFQSNPYPSLPGVVQATMRETPPPSQTQVWNPFPSRTTISADPPGEQAWNPWASIGDGDGPFGRSLQDTQRRIVGDIGAFTSDDWRPPVGNANPPLWPCPSSNAGLQSTPRVQLLDVTGAGSGFRRNMDPPGRSDFVLGPMHPVPAPASCGATWMDDPRLAQMPVAQIAERNRYAAPVLLDVTSGGQSFRPDD